LTASGGGYEGAKITEILLGNGANVHATNKHGNTALGLAQKNGHADIAALLKKSSENDSR
jgi:ankyrin repeat protein